MCARNLAQEALDQLNEQFRGHMTILRTGSDTHFWSAETCVDFFKFMRGVFSCTQVQ